MAIGATRNDIIRLVLRDGSTLVLVGLGAGLLMTVASSGVIGGFLFGVSARDSLTLVIVAPVLGAVALLACAIPAWRAARVDPTVALRAD
jgi:putative ABC transport system permease protein